MVPKNNYFLDQSRAIAYFDVDCFSCQVSLKSNPHLKAKPFATKFKGKLISVSYEAKGFGVTKGMTINEAKKKCSQLEVLDETKECAKVSDQLFDVVKGFCDKNQITIEKSSKDDFYIDLTEKCDQYMKDKHKFDKEFLRKLNVVVEGRRRQYRFATNNSLLSSYWSEAVVNVIELWDQIYHKTGLICSAGISVNKELARIACKINKPDRVTLIESKPAIARIFENIPIDWIYGLGGKKGQDVKEELNVKTLKQLRNFRRQRLISIYKRKFGNFLWEICRGIDSEPVLHKPDFGSIDCLSMPLKGLRCDSREILHRFQQKCEELVQKLNKDLNKNGRIAHRIRIEIITKSGQTLSTTLFLMSKTYDTNDVIEKISAKGFPYISDKVPKFIKGFRVMALDFRKICNQVSDPMFDITEQIQEMTI